MRIRVAALASVGTAKRTIARMLGLPPSTVRSLLRSDGRTRAKPSRHRHRAACPACGRFLAEVETDGCTELRLRCIRCECDVPVRIEGGVVSYPAGVG